MLCLSRNERETIVINGGQIVITVIKARGGQAKIGIDAPPQVTIHRGEIQHRIDHPHKTPSRDHRQA